ncbi:MAG: hypothetical protein JKP90_06545, partial [Desulfofustis sp. PB-SRB1]|nr:hypothetical protein [Desulfofustis sp. PB-SRB1]
MHQRVFFFVEQGLVGNPGVFDILFIGISEMMASCRVDLPAAERDWMSTDKGSVSFLEVAARYPPSLLIFSPVTPRVSKSVSSAAKISSLFRK